MCRVPGPLLCRKLWSQTSSCRVLHLALQSDAGRHYLNGLESEQTAASSQLLVYQGHAQVAIVDAKNRIKEGLQGNWFSCENNSGAQNTGAWVWITRPKSFMKRGAPRALRLKQSGSLPPLFLGSPPPPPAFPPSVPLPLSSWRSNFSPDNAHRGKACSKSEEREKKKRHKLFTFPHISFFTLVEQRFKSHRQGGGMWCRMSEQILDTLTGAA